MEVQYVVACFAVVMTVYMLVALKGLAAEFREHYAAKGRHLRDAQVARRSRQS